MDKEIINNVEKNSSISLKESFYCSSPEIGVKSKSNKNNNENNKYMNLFKDTDMKSNNFTFRFSSEKSTNYKSKEKSEEKIKEEIRPYKKYLTNKKNINKFISQPIIYEKNFEDENFISHSIKSGELFLHKSTNYIKEKDRKNENIYIVSNNYRKSRKKIRKNTDNNENTEFYGRKKSKRKFSLVNGYKKNDTNKEIGKVLVSSQRLITNNIKLEKNKKKEIKLKSCFTLKKEPSPQKDKTERKTKSKNRIYRINSINEKLLTNIYSFDKSNSNNKNPQVKKENNKYIKKYSSNLELQKYKSMDIKIKFDMINQDPLRKSEKLILNYKNKKEIIEILSDKENINNYYEYMEICLETLQEMNIKEVPKSNYKLKLTFPKEIQHRKLALFDLDETLVHCVGEVPEKGAEEGKDFSGTHKIKVFLPNKKEILLGINIRPHWKESLDKIKNIYNIIIFTASHRNYSDAVLNYLDPDNKYFKYRLYRDSCVMYKTNDINFYVKDLDIFKPEFDLKDIIIIDNSILSFAYHLNNGIPVVPFYDSKIDIELPLLSYYLLSIANYNDLRIANQEHIKLEFFLKQIKQIKCQEIESISTKKNFSPVKFIDESGNSKNINDNNNNEECTINDNKKENNSEKKVFHFSNFNRVFPELKRLNTINNDSNKNIDFFEKWKYAYMKLSSKK